MYERCWRRVDACREIIRAAGDFTKQVASEMITGSAETVQQAVQSGAEIAARMTEYSAANINAIVKSNVDLVEVTRILSRNWVRFIQE
jgi:microcompartment protein CcmL/EutN